MTSPIVPPSTQPVCELMLMEKPQAFIPVQDQEVLRSWRKAHNPGDYHHADVRSESSFFGPGVTRVTSDSWCNECETSMGIPHALNCSVRAKEIALARHAEWHKKQGIPCSGHPDDPYCREADRPAAPVPPPPAPSEPAPPRTDFGMSQSNPTPASPEVNKAVADALNPPAPRAEPSEGMLPPMRERLARLCGYSETVRAFLNKCSDDAIAGASEAVDAYSDFHNAALDELQGRNRALQELLDIQRASVKRLIETPGAAPAEEFEKKLNEYRDAVQMMGDTGDKESAREARAALLDHERRLREENDRLTESRDFWKRAWHTLDFDAAQLHQRLLEIAALKPDYTSPEVYHRDVRELAARAARRTGEGNG